MKRREKLILAGLLFLVAGAALGLLLRDEPEAPVVATPEIAPERDRSEYQARLAQLRGAETKPSKAGNYLDDRWGHMGDTGLAAKSLEGLTEEVFFGTEYHVAVTGDGKTRYIQSAAKPKVFEGKLVNFRSGELQRSASVVVPGGRKSGELAKRIKGDRVPMDQMPGSGFGKQPAGEGGGGAAGAADGEKPKKKKGKGGKDTQGQAPGDQ